MVGISGGQSLLLERVFKDVVKERTKRSGLKSSNVRYWHKADLEELPVNVCYSG
jgi:hypothetical protein